MATNPGIPASNAEPEREGVAVIKVARVEGGEWIEIKVHSLQMPAGAEWDEINGWRTIAPSPLLEGPIPEAVAKLHAFRCSRSDSH